MERWGLGWGQRDVTVVGQGRPGWQLTGQDTLTHDDGTHRERGREGGSCKESRGGLAGMGVEGGRGERGSESFSSGPLAAALSVTPGATPSCSRAPSAWIPPR